MHLPVTREQSVLFQRHRDECLNESWFVDLAEAQRTIEAWHGAAPQRPRELYPRSLPTHSSRWHFQVLTPPNSANNWSQNGGHVKRTIASPLTLAIGSPRCRTCGLPATWNRETERCAYKRPGYTRLQKPDAPTRMHNESLALGASLLHFSKSCTRQCLGQIQGVDQPF